MNYMLDKLKLHPKGEEIIKVAFEIAEKIGFKCINTQNFKVDIPRIIPTESLSKLVGEYPDICDKKDYKIMYYQNSDFAIEELNFIYSME